MTQIYIYMPKVPWEKSQVLSAFVIFPDFSVLSILYSDFLGGLLYYLDFSFISGFNCASACYQFASIMGKAVKSVYKIKYIALNVSGKVIPSANS